MALLSIAGPRCALAVEPAEQPIDQLQVMKFLTDRGNAECLPRDVRFFPLYPLTKKQREAGIRLFMRDRPLHVVERAADRDPKTCETILQHLQSSDAVTVLEPAFSSHFADPDMAAKIAPGCPNLDLDSDYHLDNSYDPDWWWGANPYTRDPAFLSKPREQKEDLARYYVTATANFEYYDLSRYLGEGFWGYFAEGAQIYDVFDGVNGKLVHRKTPKLGHDEFCFPDFLFTTLEKVVNVKTCQTARDPYSAIARIERAAMSGHGQQANPGFFAFIDVAGSLYRLNLRTSSGN